MKIYIDSNYPKRVIEILESVHDLQRDKRFEIIRWKDSDVDQIQLSNSIFLVVDYQTRNLSIPIIKQAADGYRTFVFKIKQEKIDRFEFMMTLLRVWPYIISKTGTNEPIYTFNYGGKKIQKYKHAS